MSEFAIKISGLSKTYKRAKRPALDGVDLAVPKGSIFGLLGPNGAGKSSVINIMAGLTVKTAGRVVIGGYDIDQDLRNVKASIGIVPQEINYDAFFTPRKALDLMAGFYGVPKAERRTMDILEMVGLEDKAEAYVRTLSGGMKRRLLMAKAMVHNPPILVLDEPTAGVDIDLRRKLWDNVRALNAQGVTILLTTHYLEEAEALCDKIAILNHGRVVLCEDTDRLLARVENKSIRFRLDCDKLERVPEALECFGAELAGARSIRISYTPRETPVESMIAAVHEAGYKILDVETDESDLEEVFLQLTRDGGDGDGGTSGELRGDL